MPTTIILLSLYACTTESAPSVQDPGRFAFLSSAEASAAACVLDTQTSLMWERKTDELGIRNWRNTYSWFDPEEAQKELDYRGVSNGGECQGSACDTWSVALAANADNFCGFNDWRIPAREELRTLGDVAMTASSSHDTPFPFALKTEYWSSNDYSFQNASAWAWDFAYNHDRVDWKKTPKAVRLVRGVLSETR